MKYTKVQVIEKAKKVLMELDYDWYFEATIRLVSSEEKDYYGNYGTNKWKFLANAPSEQFANCNDAVIGLIIDDETLEPLVLLDGTGGRIPDLKISQKNGKYFIDGIWEGV
ncbi:MAG TPA: hypothetical protein PKX92_05835 [Edaphocola sp.]|nr:hypothetical protein [Edaphocola sp.]